MSSCINSEKNYVTLTETSVFGTEHFCGLKTTSDIVTYVLLKKKNTGELKFWTYRTRNYRLFVPKTFRSQERKVPMENFHSPGTKVPGNFRSPERSFSGNWNFRSQALSFSGTFVPGNFRSWDLSYPGTFVPIIR